MRIWICLGLFAATAGIYWQASGFGFVNYDDPDYVTTSGVDLEKAFTSTEAANWFPVTRLSHMVDGALFGRDSGADHLVNVLLHGLAVVGLFLFLARATGAVWPSAFVAGLFGVHPLHVESVAWVAERKDLLCAVFWFWGLLAYVRYTERPGAARYGVVVAAFCLGLMSKPMIVTFPFLLMVIDFWPLKRGWRVREKLPLFALSAAGAGVTVWAQRSSGAVESFAAFPLAVRVGNAVLSYGVYLAQTFWPVGLGVFYPLAGVDWWRVAVAGVAVAGISAVVWKRPYLLAGWLWFLGTLVPVIGLVQVGTQAHADRYMYVPMVGLAIMVAWGGAELLGKRALWVGAGVLLVCLPLTWAQEGYWRNSESLFAQALAVTRDNSIAEHNLGSALLDEPGRLPDAVLHLRAALRINPDSPSAHSDLGIALAQSGRFEEAVTEFQTALRLKPDSGIVRENLAKAQSQMGAATAETHYNSGVDLLRADRAGEAVVEFELALRVKPDYAEAEDNLGIALAQTPGRQGEARAHFEKAVKLDPGSAQAHFNLGVALAESPGRAAEAIDQLEAAYKIKPDAEVKGAIERLRAAGLPR